MFVDLANRNDHFRRHALVEFHIGFELRDDGARQSFHLRFIAFSLVHVGGFGFEIVIRPHIVLDDRARFALNQNLHGSVGQLQKLHHRGDHADLVNVLNLRIIVARILLRDEQNFLVVLHHVFERGDGFLASHEKRHDHAGEHDNVAQRQNWIGYGLAHQLTPFGAPFSFWRTPSYFAPSP